MVNSPGGFILTPFLPLDTFISVRCMSVSTCVYVDTYKAAIVSSGVGITGIYELPDMGAEN